MYGPHLIDPVDVFDASHIMKEVPVANKIPVPYNLSTMQRPEETGTGTPKRTRTARLLQRRDRW